MTGTMVICSQQRRQLIMRQDLLKGLSEEQIAKVRACKNPEDIFSLARHEGVELTDERLAAISGGACNSTDKNDFHRKLEN